MTTNSKQQFLAVIMKKILVNEVHLKLREAYFPLILVGKNKQVQRIVRK